MWNTVDPIHQKYYNNDQIHVSDSGNIFVYRVGFQNNFVNY